jgi:hypothetical protein
MRKEKKEKKKKRASGYPGVLGVFLPEPVTGSIGQDPCSSLARSLCWHHSWSWGIRLRVAIAVLGYPLSSVLIPTGIIPRFSGF